MHQKVEGDPGPLAAVEPEPERCYWSLWLLGEGHPLPCGSASTFLAYLTSPGLKGASLLNHRESAVAGKLPFAEVKLVGPTCFDGKPLTLTYALTRREFCAMGHADRSALYNELTKRWGKPLTPMGQSYRLKKALGI